jgi:hypothetical protein
MQKLNHQTKSPVAARHWAWLLPVLALTSLPLVGSACVNSGVIGDDCPTMKDCATGGSAGSTAGTGNAVDTTCGGLLGTDCATGLYCDFPISSSCGATDQTGVCKPKPDACDDIYLPVCGCDDKTYSSDCVAHSAGISVAHKGECAGGNGTGGSNSAGGSTGTGGSSAGGSTGTGGSGNSATCGGLLPAKCPPEQYCSFPITAQCGAADQTGTCATKPDACDLIYSPVCGCDGKTYGNDCAAASAGVSVAKTGECAGGPGKTCGARVGATCAADEYCNYTPAAMCGRADATGTCAKVFEGACTANFDPVCGCDGLTYGNDCEAARAGAAVDHDGVCATTGETCGGLIGATCESGFFCNFPPAWACGDGDGTGTCTAIPEVCAAVSDPVCGCDGKPYGNACQANGNGTSVRNKGACK